MRPAFTLVEVIAAAAIASLAGIALLQMNSQSMFLFSRLKETSAMSEKLSIVGNHADKRFNHTSKTLYDILGGTYEIENDELRKYLESRKFDYSERVVETITFGGEDSGETEEDAYTQKAMEDAAAAPLIQFELVQVGIRDEDEHGAVLMARPL